MFVAVLSVPINHEHRDSTAAWSKTVHNPPLDDAGGWNCSVL